MTLYLVRHGRATAGVEQIDPGLDDIGRTQAAHAAEALRASGATRLVCSPLARAKETAAPIATALGLVPELREEIAEVFAPDMDVEGRRSMLGPLLSSKWSAQPGALREWRDRVLRTFCELGAQGDTVVVSHFVAISAAIGASTDDDRVSPCALVNASITTMVVIDGKLVLKRPGQVSHLSADEITATFAAIPGRR